MSDSDSDVEFVPVRGTPAKRRSPRSTNRVPIYTDQISDSEEEVVPVRRTPTKHRSRRGVDPVPVSNSLNTSQKISDSEEELVPVRRTPAKRRSRRGVDPVPVSNSLNTSQKISDSDSEEDCITVPSQTISDSEEEVVPVRRTPAKRRSRRVIDPVPVSNSINTSQKMPVSDVEVNSDSDAEAAPVIAPPKRRRMIDPSAIAPVPIYSNKVFSCLNLNKMPATLVKNDTTAAVAKCADAAVLPVPTAQGDSSVYLTDSEDEEPQKVTAQPVNTIIHSPSPPPPIGSPATRSTRASRRKVSDMNRKLSALGSRLRTSPLKRARQPSTPSTPTAGCGLNEDEEEGDRDVTLKFRWRSVLHKVTVPSSAPLSKAVEELSVKIKLPPSRILLLRKERELPTDSTANELGLGIADIIDCVIIQEENKEADENDDGMISIRIQNKERSAAQTYSLHRDAALGSVLRQYLSTTYPNAKRKPKVVFCFDGTTITTNQTPSQLDMEDGDVIDVWA